VDEVKIDVEQVGLTVLGYDEVVVPYLLTEGSGAFAHEAPSMISKASCGDAER
jgi:hypothetical protein